MDKDNGFKIVNVPDDFDLVEVDGNLRSGHFKKKKRGLAGFFQKIGNYIADWWHSLKKWQKAICISVSSVVALVLVGVIVLISGLGYNYNKITGNPDDLGFENVIDKKVVNIALFGVDTRSIKSLKGNSDSIMVLSVNTETKTVKIVSIMRDSLVKIEKKSGTTYNKINSAYASGGPELAIKTINQNFGLDISEYATVNFYGMAEIIDAVGGIEVELTEQEVSTNHVDGFNGLVERQCKKFKKKAKDYYIRTAGKHHVNGIQAVAYSRIRKFRNVWGTNNDFGRTDRQRYVMEQLFNKALTLPKSQYVKLVKALIPYTETSLSYGEIMGLAFDVLLKSPKFEQSRMPMNEYQMRAPSIPRVGSCVYYDLDFAKDLLHAFFYENITPEEYVEQNGIGKNDWYRNMFGGSATSTSSKDDKKPSNKKPKDESEVSSTQSTESTSSDDTSTIIETPSTSEPTSSEEVTSSEPEETTQSKPENNSSQEHTSSSASSSEATSSSKPVESSKVESTTTSSNPQ